MIGVTGFESILTLKKALENLPFDKQEEFLKSQSTDEGDVVFVRNDDGGLRLAIIEKAGAPENMPPNTEKRHMSGEDFKDCSQDEIPEESNDEASYDQGGTGDAKSHDEGDLEKGGKHRDSQTQERAEWYNDPEGERREHAKKKKSFSEEVNDLNKAFEEIEKGAEVTTKKVGGGKATQVHYGTKPETRWKHPQAKGEKRFSHNVKEGTVTVKEGEKKPREIGVGEEEKLKNASEQVADLNKAFEEMEKGRSESKDTRHVIAVHDFNEGDPDKRRRLRNMSRKEIEEARGEVHSARQTYGEETKNLAPSAKRQHMEWSEIRQGAHPAQAAGFARRNASEQSKSYGCHTNDLNKSADEWNYYLNKAKSRSAMGQYDEATVRALKNKPGVDNPYALATAIKQGTVKHK